MFYMACYDVDRFRRFVFETRFLERLDVDEARVEAIRNDDEELLDFGAQWLRFALFHDKTMKLRVTPELGEMKRPLRKPCWSSAEESPASTTAVELAEIGCRVLLVEKSASLGGRVARMHQYFPKLCPPGCGLEIHFRRLRTASRSRS